MDGILVGPYRILSELGSGGMATVYRAEVEGSAPGLSTGVPVAVKVIHPHLLARADAFKRFVREAEVGKKIRHDNVVRTYDFSVFPHEGQQLHYLVLEYVEGQTLAGLVEELGTVPEDLCLHVGREIAKALVSIHEAGIIHRDLKPENILITGENVVKVMDLGIALLKDEVDRLSQTGQFVGSVLYAAPEQFRGGKDLDGRADLYALGLILYELSSGIHPYREDDLRLVIRRLLTETPQRLAEANPQISPFFEEVVHGLIEKERDERFPSAPLVLDTLEGGEESGWWRRRSGQIRAATKRPLRRIRIPRETALYGRDRELERLRSVWESAKAGRGGVLLLDGEAGIGKSRLVDEFVGLLEKEGEDLNFLLGSHPPGGAATAFGAFSTAYREHFGAEGLEETLGGFLTVTPLLVPAFAAHLRGEPPPGDGRPLDRENLKTVYVHATRALAAERPTLVLIEDLHFAPDEARDLFAALSRAVPDHPILLVGTTRPGLPEEWVANQERLDHVHRMTVNRLTPDDLSRLLVDAFQSELMARELAPRIEEKTDGNPFFVFEIVQSLREGPFLEARPDGTWTATTSIRAIEIPSTVKDLIKARIADLGEEDQDLLDVGACCGFEFDPELVAAALALDLIPTLKRLAHLERRRRLVRAVGPRFVFDHHQVQEVFYEAIPELLREEYHALIGQTLEERVGAAEMDPAALKGETAVELCRHLMKGGLAEGSLRYLDPALAHLEKGYLNAPAIELADRALAERGLLEGPRRVEILLRKADRQEVVGLREEEAEALKEAVRHADDVGDPGLRARARLHIGRYAWSTGRSEEAERWLGEAAELAREAGDRSIEANAAGSLGLVFRDSGRMDEARERLERKLAIAVEIGDLGAQADAAKNIGTVYHYLGQFEPARDHYARAIPVFRAAGDRQAEGVTTGNLGLVYMELGRYAEAREHLERHIDIAREIGYREGEGVTLVNIGPLHAWLGDTDRAKEALERAATLLREIESRRLESFAYHWLGEIAEWEKRHSDAERFLTQALELRREIQFPIGEADTMVALGRVRLAQGRREEAEAVFQEALELAKLSGNPCGVVLAAGHLADLREEMVEKARKELETLDGDLDLATKMEARYLLFKATGEEEFLVQAHDLLRGLHEHAPPECRDRMLMIVPLHREVTSQARQIGQTGHSGQS